MCRAESERCGCVDLKMGFVEQDPSRRHRHVKGHRTKEEEKNMTRLERFIMEGNGSFKNHIEEEGVGLADSLETLGMDLRTRTKKVGAKEKARRRTCDVKVAVAKKNLVVKKNYVRVRVRKLLRMGLVLARVWM